MSLILCATMCAVKDTWLGKLVVGFQCVGRTHFLSAKHVHLCVIAGSQVCNLLWSKNVNEIVSTHGYSQNQIVVWKYPSMSKLATLTGHTLRVLYLAVSPDGQTIVTGAGVLLDSDTNVIACLTFFNLKRVRT